MAISGIQMKENHSLKPYNTFGIDVRCDYFAEVSHPNDLDQLLSDPAINRLPRLVLGGGSNILFTGDFKGLVIKNSMKGIELVREDSDHVWVKSMAGEIWHDLVLFCIDRNLGGIENLSLIPGLVGAAPMQNIGAYGVELKDVFESLEAYRIDSRSIEVFDAKKCAFGYRESIFKKELKGQYIILSITLKLSKNPVFNVSYGAIQSTLQEMNVEEPSTRAISDAVIRIRSSKLPDPAELGNAGSFFKNPEIPMAHFDRLSAAHPAMPHYPIDEATVKIPAGWLIEQCGWKGKVVGNTGAHKDQALVLVNYGEASGREIVKLADQIRDSVKQRFGIELQPEVNII